MGKFVVNGVETTGPEDWKRAMRKLHWKTGHSAKALAYSWQEAGGFPSEVRKVFEDSGIELFKKMEFVNGYPEYVVPLPGGRRGSHNDIFVSAKSHGEPVPITIEGKVSEDFGPLVREWLGDHPSPRSGKLRRLRFLEKLLDIEGLDTGGMRYQLLHRTASALILAQQFDARRAVMLVHSFSQESQHFGDYQSFLGLLGVRGSLNSVTFAGEKCGIELYLAWVTGKERFLRA